jgi:hypothetical protein
MPVITLHLVSVSRINFCVVDWDLQQCMGSGGNYEQLATTNFIQITST